MTNVMQIIIGTIMTAVCLSAFAKGNDFYLGTKVEYAGHVSITGVKNSTAHGVRNCMYLGNC